MKPAVLAVLFFVLAGLGVLAEPVQAQSSDRSTCQPMYREGPKICIKPVDSTPLARRTPVLLIHGWSRDRPGPPSQEVWENFIFYAGLIPWVGDKFKFYEVTYYSNLVSVSTIGTELAELVDQMDASDPNFAEKKIFLIGHSMGGLVARAFMQENRLQNSHGIKAGDRVIRLVTLATPHHGTPVANGPARDDQAGPLGGLIFDFFDSTIFRNTSWSDHNRYDLHADAYLAKLTQFDYQRFPRDANWWLDQLNASNSYLDKISAYGGSINTWKDWGGGCETLGNLFDIPESDLMDCTSLLINRLYDHLWNDGIVPSLSTFFPECISDCTNETFFGYDHFRMAQGESPYDSYLFGAILGDLSDAVFSSDNRFNSSIIFGNPISEAFHNLRGWGDPGRNPVEGTYRNQTVQLANSVDLFVRKASVPYTLTFKRFDGGCNDNFYVYIGVGSVDMSLDLFLDKTEAYRCIPVTDPVMSQGTSIYQWKIPDWLVKQNRIRVKFIDGRGDGSGSAPMFYVRLDPQ